MFSQLFSSKKKGNNKILESSDLYRKLEVSNQIIDDRTSEVFLPEVSIIISCRNEINTLKKTVDSMINSKNKLSFEIIIVDDGSTDGSSDFLNTDKDKYKDVKLIYSDTIGVASARNLGAKSACGKYLFFCDAHIVVPDYWFDNLIKTLEENDAHAIAPTIKNMENEDRGYGGVWNNNLGFTWLGRPEKNGSEIPLMPGCAFGIKKDIFEAVGGFDDNFEIYGVEDQEISLKLWLFGYRIIVDTSVEIEHLFKINNSYKITNADIIYNYLCLVYSHFDYENLTNALSILKNNTSFSLAAAKVVANENLLRQRKEYFYKRKYDEDYFFKKFNIPF